MPITMSPRLLRRHLVAAATVATFALAQTAAASEQDIAKGEIDHLLQFVGTSACTFVRNGTEYPAGKAAEHLAGKYRFAGSRIATAEQFIQYLGTGSSMSGEPYQVRCGKSQELSAQWLTAELKRYRSAPKLQPVSR